MTQHQLAVFGALIKKGPDKALKYLAWNISRADAQLLLRAMQERLNCRHCGRPGLDTTPARRPAVTN